MTGCVSPQTLCDLVAREGEPWGLVPFYDAERGKVFVCERVMVGESRGGLLQVDGRPVRIIGSVSEDRPFSALLANRLQNGETDLAGRARMHDLLEEKRKRLEEIARDRAIKARWRARNQLVAGPTGVINRQARRAAAAIKRRAEGW